MIAGLLTRHYKNYGNVRFIPLLNNTDYKFTIYIGNNGVGKSAILEALDLVLNGRRQWNVTQGEKKTEAYICPIFLIHKNDISPNKKKEIETISNYFWSDEPDKSSVASSSSEIKLFIDFKNQLKVKYEETHYLILLGLSYDTQGAFFASFDNSVKNLFTNDEQHKKLNTIKDYILGLYSFLYIPVEESPQYLLQLQNEAMQKLLNKDIQQEIEKILNTKQNGDSIVGQINKNLDNFINEVNGVISKIDSNYSFAPESRNKQRLTAKDIRAKIIEAFFPLRSLKKGQRRVDLLSSGEQRKAIIDVAYATLMANRNKKTERHIILAIDEPEISMHISNCYSQFSRLEELSTKNIQVILTTHWYGYLPIAQNGMLHYLKKEETQTKFKSFELYDLLEKKKQYPSDDIEMKSIFDLASSIMSYTRREPNDKWIFCEGCEDKLYLESMLNHYKILHIIPLGGCGNVIKLFNIMLGFTTEKAEKAQSKMLFLIDTDKERISIKSSSSYSAGKSPITLKRLQIVNTKIELLDPTSGGTYEQTEIEDCLNPQIYYNAIKEAIKQKKDNDLIKIFNNYNLIEDAPNSVIRGDNACIRATAIEYVSEKKRIIDFIEDETNKKKIAQLYSRMCQESNKKIIHPLANLIMKKLGLR